MKRTSSVARKTAVVLQAHYGFVEPEGALCRRLERYSQAGLLPTDESVVEVVAAHVAGSGLRDVYRPGPGSAERAVLVLAARGYGCRDLPKVLAGLWGNPEPPPVEARPDPRTREGAKAVADEVNTLIDWGDDGAPGAPAALGDFVQRLLSSARSNLQAEPLVDRVTGRPEPVEGALSSGFEVLANGLYGDVGAPSEESLTVLERMGHPIDAEGAESYVPLPKAVEMVARFLPWLPFMEEIAAFAARAATTSELGLDDFVRGAVTCHRFLAGAPVFVRSMLGGGGDDENLDYVADMLSPFGNALGMMTALAHLATSPDEALAVFDQLTQGDT